MKRIIVSIITTAIILSIAACSAQSSVTVTMLPRTAAAPTPAAAAEASDTASPSALAELLPFASASASPTQEQKTVYKGPTIIATFSTLESFSGEIRGGYYDGKWLSPSEAAALCKGKMEFNEYNLVDLKGTVKSSGVEHDDEVDSFSLKTPSGNDETDYYGDDPLCYSYLYYGGIFPDIKIVSDTSKVSRAVQKLLDEKLGKGKAKADIKISVSVDIDGDGKEETVVNADCVGGYYFGGDDIGSDDIFDEGDFFGYCLCCIIESDGTVKTIFDYYDDPTAEDPSEEASFFYVQNIIDMDGDGISELVVDWTYYSESGMSVYKYDGNNVDEIMDYSVIYDIS